MSKNITEHGTDLAPDVYSRLISSVYAIQEIIQNAEDAGARDVKFLYDKTQYGQDASKLYHPELRHFQVCQDTAHV